MSTPNLGYLKATFLLQVEHWVTNKPPCDHSGYPMQSCRAVVFHHIQSPCGNDWILNRPPFSGGYPTGCWTQTSTAVLLLPLVLDLLILLMQKIRSRSPNLAQSSTQKLCFCKVPWGKDPSFILRPNSSAKHFCCIGSDHQLFRRSALKKMLSHRSCGLWPPIYESLFGSSKIVDIAFLLDTKKNLFGGHF